MGKYNAHVQRFNVGEYSDSALTRTDLEDARLAAEIQENIFPHKIGKGLVRPGTTYLGRTYNDQRARLVSFARTPNEKALLELTNLALRVWVDDALVTRNSVECQISGLAYNAKNWKFYFNGTQVAAAGAGDYIQAPGNGIMYFEPIPRGGEVVAQCLATTNSPSVEHGLYINVTKGPIRFKIGTAVGGQDLFAETLLGTGKHSLGFTPPGSFCITFTHLIQRQVEISQVSIEEAGPMVIPAPWVEADLQNFQFEQSADVIFCANRGVRPLQIVRRGNTSWSISNYEPLDGPFRDVTPGYGEAGVGVSTAGYAGSILANKPVLSAGMEDSLIRVFHDRRNNAVELADENTWCDPFRVQGVKGETHNDRVFDYSITGTASGTIRFQRSVSGESGNYAPTPRDETNKSNYLNVSGSVSFSQNHKGFSVDNNLVAYHRIGFGPGDYTSGIVSVSVTYEGDSGYGVGFLRNVNEDLLNSDVEWIELYNAQDTTYAWSIGAWSDAFEWPSGVAIFDGRLWWGGLDRVWGSANGDFFSFDDRNTTDLATITRKLGTGGQTSQVNFLLPLQRLVVGTSGSEMSIRSSSVGEVLTINNTTVRSASSYGSAIVAPVRLDSRGIFIHRDGVTSLMLDYDAGAKDYATAKLTEMNDEILLPGCTELAVQRQPETYVYHIRSDGEVAMLNVDLDDPDERLIGWSRFITDGVVESMAVLPDDDQDAVYLSVKRNRSTGSTVYPQETNADVLLGDETLGWAMDLTDGSFTQRWIDEPVHYDRLSNKEINVERRITATREDGVYRPLLQEDYGIVPGPDEYYMGWWNLLGVWSQPIMTRQPDGTLRFQQHNFIYRTEQFGSPKTGYPGPYSLYDVLNTNYAIFYENVDINSDNDSFLAVDGENNVTISPRGDMTGGRMFSDTRTAINGQHSFRMFLQVEPETYTSYAYSSPAGWVSFSAKPAELSVIEIAFSSYNATFPSFIAHQPEDVGTSSNQSGSCITYRIDLETGTVTKVFEEHAFTTQDLYIYEFDVEEQPNGWYRYHFKYSTHEDATWCIRILDENLNASYVADGKGFYIWGLQDKLDGTDNHRTYLRQYDNFFAFPSNGSKRQQLMPIEWDEDGNCLGMYCYDWDLDYIEYWSGQDPRMGAVSYFGEGTPVDGDTTGYTGRLDGGTSYVDSSKLGPDSSSLAGVWTDDDGGNVASPTYCGLRYRRLAGFARETGQAVGAMFVKYDGSARYFTICHYNGAPSEDTWYSVTWDVVTGEVTEEYYQPGNATGSNVISNRRAKAGEWYANGWFRFMSGCSVSYNSSSYVYYAMSNTPTPGAQTNGIDNTTGTGNTLQVWYPTIHANIGYENLVAGAVRGTPRNFQYTESPCGIIPIGKDPGNYNIDHMPRTDREVLMMDADCFRYQQTIVPRDAWLGEGHFYTEGAGVDPFYDYFGWPYSYDWSSLQTNAHYGGLIQFDDDPKFDYYGYQKYSDVWLSPNGELSPVVIGADTFWYPPEYASSFPPEGANPITAIAFEVGKEYTHVINAIENYGVEFYCNDILLGKEETLAPHFRPDLPFLWQDSMVAFYPLDPYNSYAWNGTGDRHGDFHLKSIKMTSQCGPDEPRFIERLNKHDEALGDIISKMADAGNYFAGPVSAVTVPQHAGRGDLIAWGTRVSDGVTGPLDGPLAAGSDGSVALGAVGETFTDVFIGLPYTARYKSGKLAYAAEGGTSIEQPKKITEFGILLNDTHKDAVKYGEDFDRMRSIPSIYKGKTVQDNTVWSEYDDTSFSLPGSWNTDSRLCLKVVAPYPATFTGLVISIEANPRGGKS